MQTTPVPEPARQPGINGFMIRFLQSPLGAMSGRVVLVRYTGRASGEIRRLPVNCEPFESGYLIRVGHADQKRWWRNFREPWPIELVKGRKVIHGSAVAVPGTTGRGQRIAEEYFMTHRGAARRAGLPRVWKGEAVTAEQMQAAAATLTFIVVTPDAK